MNERELSVSDDGPGAWATAAAIAALLGVAAFMLAGCNGGKTSAIDGLPRATPIPLGFGVVAVGSERQAELEVRNEGNARLKIVGVAPVGSLPSAFLLPGGGQAIDAGATTKLAFRFEPGEEQTYGGQIDLRTDSRQRPVVRIDLAGQGRRPQVQCSARLDFGRVVLNLDRYANIVCVNSTDVDATVHIAGVSGPDAALFAVGTNLTGDSTVLKAHSSGTVESHYQAGYLGPATATATLEVMHGSGAPMEIPLTGEAFTSDFWIEPGTVDFGAVYPGMTKTAQVTFVNNGTTEVIVTEIDLTDPDHAFAAGSKGAVEIHVPPASRVPLDVSFLPPTFSAYTGSLAVTTTDAVNRHVDVGLRGKGGGPRLVVAPDHVDFGMVASGMPVTAHVRVTNGGTADGGDLVVNAATITGDPASFAVAGLVPGQHLAPGASIDLTITFRPAAAGSFAAALHLVSNDAGRPQVDVPLVGRARTLAPCSYSVTPPAIDFGTVSEGGLAVQVAKLRNTGRDDCVFSAVEMAPGSDAAFDIVGGAIAVATVAPGQELAIPVGLDSTRTGFHQGAVAFAVSNPASPTGSIPVTATAADGCIVATPGAVDFGEERLSCPPEQVDVTLRNACAGTATLGVVKLQNDNGKPGEFSLVPPAIMVLPPGGTAVMHVRYDAQDPGPDSAEVVVNSPSLPTPLSIPISGTGTSSNSRTNRFVQLPRQAADVLWVVDNSGSMTEEQQAIADGFEQFIDYAVKSGIDYHIGVTTTGITRSGGGWTTCPGGVDGGEAGRLFPADGTRPRYITATTSDAVNVFKQNVKVGLCHWWEEGLEAAYLALSPPVVDHADDPQPTQASTYLDLPNDGNLGFYRADAKLTVIVVSDEDDHASRPAAFYTTFFENLKGPGKGNMVNVDGLVGDNCPTASGAGFRYDEVISGTGGISLSICSKDWTALLNTLAEDAFGYQRRFQLSGRPQAAVSVQVNGADPGGWTYDPASNSVVFDKTHVPAPGSTVSITYTPACKT